MTDLGLEIQTEDFEKSQDSKHLRIQEEFAAEADFKMPFSVEKYRSVLSPQGKDI